MVLGVVLEENRSSAFVRGTRLIGPGNGKLWRCFVERSMKWYRALWKSSLL